MNEFLLNNQQYLRRLWKLAAVLLGVLIIFFIVLSLSALKGYSYIGMDERRDNTLVVNGSAEVFAVPDIAEFNFTLFQEALTVNEARDAVTAKEAEVLRELEALGIEERDIRTQSYNIYPRYEYRNITAGVIRYPEGERVLVGYEVRQTLSVKVRETARVGDVVGAVSEFVSEVYGPVLTIDDEDDLRREARQKAIQEARKNARELARDLGVNLGKVVSFNEGGNGSYPAPMMAKYDMAVAEVGADSAALPVGENKISSQVTIVYQIK